MPVFISRVFAIAAPPESELSALIDAAPPVRGGEYFNLGVLVRLWAELDADAKPELLFVLRSVDQGELIAHAASATQLVDTAGGSGVDELDETDVSAIFGIEIDQGGQAASVSAAASKPVSTATKRPTGKKQPESKVKVKVAKKKSKSVGRKKTG